MQLIKQKSAGNLVVATMVFFTLSALPDINHAKCVLPLEKLTGVYKYTDLGNGSVNRQYGKLDKKNVYTVDGSLDYPLDAGLTVETLSQINGKTLLTLAGWTTYENASYCLAPFSRSTATYSIDGTPWVIVAVGKQKPVKPVVSVVATSPDASETGAHGEFLITLNAPVSTDVVVHYKLKGTAKNGKDYTAIPAKTRILQGNISAVVDVAPLADGVAEGAETVVLMVNRNGKYVVGDGSVATVNITE